MTTSETESAALETQICDMQAQLAVATEERDAAKTELSRLEQLIGGLKALQDPSLARKRPK